tara:strand:- start:72 stop:875 length:804 start_codon:yes stop_codon:yes gene_type:complete
VLENLSGDLRRRLVFQSYEQVIMSVRLLRWKGVDGRLIELVVTSSKPQLLKVGDYLVRKGDVVHGLYVVRRGHIHGLKCNDRKEYGNYVEGANEVNEKEKDMDVDGKNDTDGTVGTNGADDKLNQPPLHRRRTMSMSSSIDESNDTQPWQPTIPTISSKNHGKSRSSVGMGVGKRTNNLIFCMEDGHTICESDILATNLTHEHSYHCIATTICDMLMIPKSTIYHIRSHYPEFYRKFRNISNHRKKLLNQVCEAPMDPLGRGKNNNF